MRFLDTADVIVIGAGPAGSAAAICCARIGLRTLLLDRVRPDPIPGETIHPGAECLFDELGISDHISRAASVRHEGHRVRWFGPERSLKFGADQTGTWRGFQLQRDKLRTILHARARAVGVRYQEDWARGPIVEGDRIAGVRTNAGSFRSRYTIDASGRAHWLARAFGLAIQKRSPTLIAWYGWVRSLEAKRFAEPLLVADRNGWTWVAQIDQDVCAWTRLDLRGRIRRPEVPPRLLSDFRACSRPRGADVTWRRLLQHGGPGFFIVGDAGAALDPASANGVIRAIMSGIAAARCIGKIVAGRLPEEAATAEYVQWTLEWHKNNERRLLEQYLKDFHFLALASSWAPET